MFKSLMKTLKRRFEMVCQLPPWRPSEARGAGWGDSPRWETRHSHFWTVSSPSQGWHGHGRDAPPHPPALSVGGAITALFPNEISMASELFSKQDHWLVLANEIKVIFHFSQQMYWPWGRNLERDSILKRHENFLASFVIVNIMQVTWNPEKMQEEPRWILSCDGQKGMRTVETYSCFLTAYSFQGKHKEYAIFLEMKSIRLFWNPCFSTEWKVVHSKGELWKCCIWQWLAVGFLTSSHKGLELGRREREIVYEGRNVDTEEEKIITWSRVHSLGKRAVRIFPWMGWNDITGWQERSWASNPWSQEKALEKSWSRKMRWGWGVKKGNLLNSCWIESKAWRKII